MRWIRAFSLLLLAVAPACNNQDNTKIVVVVWSDLPVPSALDGVHIEIAGPTSTAAKDFALTAGSESGKTQLPVQLQVVPAGAKDESVMVEVTGKVGASPVVTRTASVRFVSGEALRLDISLDAACRDVVCPGGFTCSGGICNQPIPITSLPPYTGKPARPDAGHGLDGGVLFDGGTALFDVGTVIDGRSVDLTSADAASTEAASDPSDAGRDGTPDVPSIFEAGVADVPGALAEGGGDDRTSTVDTNLVDAVTVRDAFFGEQDGPAMDAAIVPVCQANATQCSGNGVQTCAGGQWGAAAVACGANQTCASSAGSAACACKTDPKCSASGFKCADTSTLVNCTKDSQGCLVGTPTPCPTGLVCQSPPGIGGACLDVNRAKWPVPNSRPDVSAGAPNLETYTANANGTVADNVTGLVWQHDVPTTTYVWVDAVSYCQTLALGSQSDWHLPSLVELTSIADFSKSNPSIQSVFGTTPVDYYWSSVAVSGAPGSAWVLDFAGGNTLFTDVSKPHAVRCVRGNSASDSGGQYTVATGTVLDNKTKLIWQQTLSSTPYAWTDAKQYCATGLLGGVWRLPTVKELLTIVDYSVDAAQATPAPVIDAVAFPATPRQFFWSASQAADGSAKVWAVNFGFGGAGPLPTSSAAGQPAPQNLVRCVMSSLQAAPASVNFGFVPPSQLSSVQTVVITNALTTTATGKLKVGLSGTGATQVVLSADTCTASTLAPGKTCSLAVQYKPTDLTGVGGSIDITDGTASGSVPIQGTAQSPFTVSPTTLDFGSVDRNQAPVTKDITVTLLATATTDTGTLTVAKSDGTSQDFVISANTCTAPLSPFASTCKVSVTFVPSGFGTEQSTLIVTAAKGGTASVALQGTGIATYSRTIAAMMTSSCTGCHATTAGGATIVPALDNYASVSANATTTLQAMQGKLLIMPPPPAQPLGAEQIAAFQAWLSDGTPNN